MLENVAKITRVVLACGLSSRFFYHPLFHGALILANFSIKI